MLGTGKLYLIQSMRKRTLLRRGMSIFLGIVLLFQQSAVSAGSGPEPVNPPAEITIPDELGTIEKLFSGNSGKTIIYIQDAHDSLEAQENIAKIIDELVQNHGVRTVFEEGYEGLLPTDEYFGGIDKRERKEKLAYFLMDKLRLGGAEYAHINRITDFKLIGIDDYSRYSENITAYQKAAEVKEETSKDLLDLKNSLQRLANQSFPKQIKEWLKLKERVDTHKLDLLDYLKRTRHFLADKYSTSKYPAINLMLEASKNNNSELLEMVKGIDAKALFQEIDYLEDEVASTYLSQPTDRTIFKYLKGMQLLLKLNEIEVTADEYEAMATTLAAIKTQDMVQFIADAAKKPLSLSKKWESNVNKAKQFYELAHQRDQALGENLKRYSEDESISVLVFGGFHKNKIQEILRQQDYTVYTVTPKISSLSKRHQDYYKQIMGGGHHNFETPLFVAAAAKPLDVMDRALRYTPLLLAQVANSPSIDWLLEWQLIQPEIENVILEKLRSEVRTLVRSQHSKGPLPKQEVGLLIQDIRNLDADTQLTSAKRKAAVRGKIEQLAELAEEHHDLQRRIIDNLPQVPYQRDFIREVARRDPERPRFDLSKDAMTLFPIPSLRVAGYTGEFELRFSKDVPAAEQNQSFIQEDSVNVALWDKQREIKLLSLKVAARNYLEISRPAGELPLEIREALWNERSDFYGRLVYYNLNWMAVIEDFKVHESLQGAGIGKVFYQKHIESYLKQSGFKYASILGSCLDCTNVSEFWTAQGYRGHLAMNELYMASTEQIFFSVKALTEKTDAVRSEVRADFEGLEDFVRKHKEEKEIIYWPELIKSYGVSLNSLDDRTRLFFILDKYGFTFISHSELGAMYAPEGFHGPDSALTKFKDAAALHAFIQSRHYVDIPHPEGGGGTHFNTRFYPDLKLVRKTPNRAKSRTVLASVNLAKERLGGLIARFVVLEDEHETIIYQESLPSLKSVINKRIEQGQIESATGLLRKFFEVITGTMRRGVFDWDPKIENYGVVEARDQVVLLDIGGFVDAQDVLDEPDVEESSIEFFQLKIGEGVPSELSKDFLSLQQEFGFDNGGATARTLEKLIRPGEAITPHPVIWTPSVTIVRSEISAHEDQESDTLSELVDKALLTLEGLIDSGVITEYAPIAQATFSIRHVLALDPIQFDEKRKQTRMEMPKPYASEEEIVAQGLQAWGKLINIDRAKAKSYETKFHELGNRFRSEMRTAVNEVESALAVKRSEGPLVRSEVSLTPTAHKNSSVTEKREFIKLLHEPKRKGTLTIPVGLLNRIPIDFRKQFMSELVSAISDPQNVGLILYSDTEDIDAETAKFRNQLGELPNVMVVSEGRNEALATWGLPGSVAVDLFENENDLDFEFTPGERIKKLKHVRLRELGDILLAKLVATIPEDQLWMIHEVGGVMELLPGFRAELQEFIAQQAVAWSA